MEFIDTINIQRYHRDRVEKHGEGTSGALGWKQLEGQLTRFEVLSGIGDLNNCSVLDVGCGHGDLCAFLNNKYKGLRYLGIDLDEHFLKVAIGRYAHIPETSFFHGDFSSAELPATDYILACGALSYRSIDPGYVYKAITTLFGKCRLGLAFNMLSKSDNHNGLLVAYEPELILNHCRKLSSKVIYKEGYYEDDFTVMVFHE